MSDLIERLSIKDAVKPWANYHGDLPDYDHPLRCVFESGIQYAVELLAKKLGVENYEPCDGTEEFDGDLGGTLMNIVMASLPTDEHGDPQRPSEICERFAALTRLTADNKRLREAIGVAVPELDGLTKALALLGRLDLTTAINRDIAAPLRQALGTP